MKLFKKKLLCFLFGHKLVPPEAKFVGRNGFYIGITKCYRCSKDVQIKFWKHKIGRLDIVEYRIYKD